jgi:hypothetical protein
MLCIGLCCPFALYYSTWIFWNQNDRRTSQSFGLLRGISIANQDKDLCKGSEKLLEIIAASGFVIDSTTRDLICATMPSWDEITGLYGDKPHIVGLETCAAYRAKIKKAKANPMPRVAGMF